MVATRRAARQKTRNEFSISEQLRRPAGMKKALLEWLGNNPKFQERKPTIDEMVEEMRRKGSKIGKYVEQDIQSAAEKYWHDEAQYLLRHVNMVRVDIITEKVITKPVRYWQPIKIEKNGRIPEHNYVPAQKVYDTPEFKFTVLERAHADFLAWLSRWERYSEFMEVFQPVIEAFRKLEKKISKKVSANGNGHVGNRKVVAASRN